MIPPYSSWADFFPFFFCPLLFGMRLVSGNHTKAASFPPAALQEAACTHEHTHSHGPTVCRWFKWRFWGHGNIIKSTGSVFLFHS